MKGGKHPHLTLNIDSDFLGIIQALVTGLFQDFFPNVKGVSKDTYGIEIDFLLYGPLVLQSLKEKRRAFDKSLPKSESFVCKIFKQHIRLLIENASKSMSS